MLLGTLEVALVAMAVAFPLALMFALFISEYAPAGDQELAGLRGRPDGRRAEHHLRAVGVLPPACRTPSYLARWISQYLGWIPIFKVDTDPNAAVWQQSRYTSSAFIAGLTVSMMVIPLACSVMRGVFAQAPIGEREAAMALGATRWGMIRTVVLPFGAAASSAAPCSPSGARSARPSRC